MIRFAKKITFNPFIVFLVVFCGGCFGGPDQVTNYYLYSPVSSSDMPFDPEMKLSSREIIAVGPVNLPPELERAGIVVKSGDRRIQVSRTRVWVASLDELMAAALVRNLSIILGTDQVEAYPGSSFVDVRYRIKLEVVEFSGELKNEFNCEVVWSLVDKGDNGQGRIMARQRFVNRQPLPDADYETYVAAASRSLADLAREIVSALHAAEVL